MDFGWSELLVIGVVALIVIGPKDLPEMFRTLGRFTAKARGMARDFSRAMEQAAKETGVDEVASDLKKVTSPKAMGLDAMKGAADRFEKWDPLKNAAKPTSPPSARPLTPPPMPPTPPAAPPAPVSAAVAAPEPAIMGPATAALAEQQAQRKAIAAEAAEKLRAVGKPAATAKPPVPAAKPAKTAASAAPSADMAAKPARKKAPAKADAKPGEE
jgi:sec-independent protein translocase protein TatB